jgi:hypothetical protein
MAKAFTLLQAKTFTRAGGHSEKSKGTELISSRKQDKE